MIQRIFEAVTGFLASAIGLWILFSFAAAFFPPNQIHDLSGQPAPPLAWIPALQVFVIALVGIALGVLLHGVPSIAHTGRDTRRFLIWGGRLTLWLSTAALIVLAFITLPSIGLLFGPSAALAFIACALAIVPNSEPALLQAHNDLPHA
jgi:hypothetical protein